MSRRVAWCCGLLLAALPVTARAQMLVRVPADGTLQTAIGLVSDGGVIEIAAGTYAAPAGGFVITNQAKRFTIRAATAAAVTLSGGGTDVILRLQNSSVSAGRPVVFQGLVFASGRSTTPGRGGAVSILNGQATFFDCVFQNSVADVSTNGGGGIYMDGATAFFFGSTWSGNSSKSIGGAMVVANGSRAYVHRGTLLNNRTNMPNHIGNADGGGIHVSDSLLRVTNSRFEGNQSGYVGGAIYALGTWGLPNTTVTVADSTFLNNQAIRDASVSFPAPEIGGAIHIEDQTIGQIYNCRFVTNNARQGGAVSSYRASLLVSSSVFQGNTSFGTGPGESFGGAIISLSDDNNDASTGGGAINRPSAQLIVADTLLQGRFGGVTTTGRQGGCVFAGGDLNRAYGLNGVSAMGTPASNRSTVSFNNVVFADCDVQNAASVPGTGGGLGASLLTLTVTNSLFINSDASDGGGGMALTNNSTATVTGTTFARNTAGASGGGAVWVLGSVLNMSGSNLIENGLTSNTLGGAIFSAVTAAGGGLPALPVSGSVQNCVLSNNGAPGVFTIFEGDSSTLPINSIQYSANAIFPNSAVMFNGVAGVVSTVAALNSLVVTHSGTPNTDKAPSNDNTAPGSAPVAGAIRAVPPAKVPTGAIGDAAGPTVAYVGYGWSGGSATLDGSPRAGNSGLEAAGPGAHTLSVAGSPFAATVFTAPAPQTSLIASPPSIASGGSTTLFWSTVAGTFLDEAIDEGVAITPAASGSVGVSPVAVTTGYRGYLVAAEGGAVNAFVLDVTGTSDLVFRNGFESGNLGAWSVSSATDGGDLSVSPSAAMDATTQGLSALVDDTNSLYAQDDSPAGQTRYRGRFYIDPNGFDPGEAQSHFRIRVFIAFDNVSQRTITFVLKRQAGVFSVMGRVRRTDGTRADTGFFDITDGPHYVEFDWKRASSPGALDGAFQIWIDGVPTSSLNGIDNGSATVEFARLGTIAVKTGAAGTVFLDELESRTLNFIGP